MKQVIFIVGLLALVACGGQTATTLPAGSVPTTTPPFTTFGPSTNVVSPTPTLANWSLDLGDVIGVSASGTAGNYSMSVTVASLETGCDSYADWWEVVSEDGELLYRRVLLHSHVDEQPFTRSGGPVDIQADDTVIIRAHMNGSGYVGRRWKGTVAEGFAPAGLDTNFAADLENQGPLPASCAF